ncbi:MAG: transglycosylase SLT domain-containing protein [Candidatus Dormibacteraeota bacterium]|nr:transglycosylase SLT domain-containing protein [Candidatus Dormibacteraeota bacterium]
MPTRTRFAAAVGATTLLPASVVAGTYIIHPGDTLGDIAVRHATTVAALAGANGIDAASALQPGRMLLIPDATLLLPAYTRDAADVESYAVQRGEGIVEVARRFGVDPTALARTNGVGVNAQLSRSDELQVPGRLARMNALITHVADQTGCAAIVVRAVAWMESQWQQDLVSPTGAVGVMQLEPFTGEWVSRHIAGRRLDIWVAQDNVTAGALLLRRLMDEHQNDAGAAVAAYYQGASSIRDHGVFDDTARYQRQVQRLMADDG